MSKKQHKIWERFHQPVLPARKFYLRMGKYVGVAIVIGGVSLLLGMVGYRWFEGQEWPEAFINAAMLLSAMGPVSDPQADTGKIFASCYALYCGLVFLFTAGLLLTPVAHRLLDVFHSDPDEETSTPSKL